MGKSTISMAIFNSKLLVIARGYKAPSSRRVFYISPIPWSSKKIRTSWNGSSASGAARRNRPSARAAVVASRPWCLAKGMGELRWLRWWWWQWLTDAFYVFLRRVAGWLLEVAGMMIDSQWIIPENSLLSTSKMNNNDKNNKNNIVKC